MARRERTDEFMEYRMKMKRGFGHSISNVDPFEKGNDRPIGWMENVHDIECDIQKIENKMAELSTLHKDHLLPGFDMDDSHSDLVRDIEILTADITRSYQNSFLKVKKIGAGTNLSSEEIRMKKNIQSSLASRLQNLSSDFKKSQRDYLSKLRGLEEKGDDPFALDMTKVNTSLSDALIEDVSFSTEMAVQRESELRNLVKSIEELNSIFKDISILVIEQGTVLDRIDYNIESAEHHVEHAEQELVIAHEKAKSSRTKLAMIILCTLILIVIGAIFIRLLTELI